MQALTYKSNSNSKLPNGLHKIDRKWPTQTMRRYESEYCNMLRSVWVVRRQGLNVKPSRRCAESILWVIFYESNRTAG